MARGRRTTMRLESDVRKYLEESKEKYAGMDMTAVMHFAVRYVRDQKVLQEFLKENKTPSAPNNSEDQTEGAVDNNEGATMDRENGPSGGVSFNDISRTQEEEEQGEDESTRGSDESNSGKNGSSDETSETDGGTGQSAASSLRNRFRG